jgi:hypothetical protein
MQDYNHFQVWGRGTANLAQGEGHDSDCEQRIEPNATGPGGMAPGFYVCHCRRRARITRGLLDLPTDPPEFPPPQCPVGDCGRDLDHDGDNWHCTHCHITWHSGRGERLTPEWDDTYATDDATLLGQAEAWVAARRGGAA